jgi:hypothetical protein
VSDSCLSASRGDNEPKTQDANELGRGCRKDEPSDLLTFVARSAMFASKRPSAVAAQEVAREG